MPYQPRPLLSLACAHCGRPYTARHARSTYCSRSCNVRASHARNGRPKGPAPAATPVPVPVPASSRPVAAGRALAEQLCHLVVNGLAAIEAHSAAQRAAMNRVLGRPPAPAE